MLRVALRSVVVVIAPRGFRFVVRVAVRDMLPVECAFVAIRDVVRIGVKIVCAVRDTPFSPRTAPTAVPDKHMQQTIQIASFFISDTLC